MMAKKVTPDALLAFAQKVDAEGDFHEVQGLADQIQSRGHEASRAELTAALRGAMLVVRAYADLAAALSFALAMDADREKLEADLRAEQAG
jgi:hypothetical protein